MTAVTYGQSLTNGDTHASCCAFNHSFSTLNVDHIEIFELNFGDLTEFFATDRADLVLVWNRRPFFNTSSLLQKIGHGRGLRNKCKRTIFVDRDFRWDDHTHLVLSTRIILLTERHNVDALRA